jgi:SNF2 family DNA or RNA helicase
MGRCLQHPYLYDDGIEPRDLTPEETHGKLIDASAKFRLLKILLPKLKARGHRVLLFSQVLLLFSGFATTSFLSNNTKVCHCA